MRVGLIGTGAIAQKHAQAYKNIGFELLICSNRNVEAGEAFAARNGAAFVPASRMCAGTLTSTSSICVRCPKCGYQWWRRALDSASTYKFRNRSRPISQPRGR